MTQTPAQSIQNEPSSMPYPAMIAPITPKIVPNMNPARRPIRRIKWDAGIVASMTPAWCVASGSVSQPGAGVRILPARGRSRSSGRCRSCRAPGISPGSGHYVSKDQTARAENFQLRKRLADKPPLNWLVLDNLHFNPLKVESVNHALAYN